MKTFFIRHAEKEKGDYFNSRLRHQDEPISAEGRRRAELLGQYFAGRPIAGIYVSGYLRTRQTIEPVARRLGLIPVVDERLNEIDNGSIDGLSDMDIRDQYPEVWRGYTERTADFRFPGGESGEEVRLRVASFLEEMRGQYPDGQIVLVAHDGLIRVLMCHIMGLPVYHRWNFHIDFCGITEFDSLDGPGQWKLIRFNQSVG